MSMRFRKSIKIAPGVRFNIGKKGGSLTVGPRGGSINFGSQGVHSNIGIPGTGISYRTKLSGETSPKKIASNQLSKPKSTNQFKQVKISLSLQDDGSVLYKDENGNLLDDYLITQAKKQNKEFFYGWLEENCCEINNNIASIINIHLTTPSPDTNITFTPLPFEEIPPIEPSSVFSEPQPVPVTPKRYGFFSKRIGFFKKLVDKKNYENQLAFQKNMAIWNERRNLFESDYQSKLILFNNSLNEYQKRKSDFEEQQESRRILIEEARYHDQKAMSEFLSESLHSIIWPRETMISFDITKDSVFLDVDLPEIEDMPDQEAVVSKKDFRILYKELSDNQKRKNYYTHIHSIGFRVVGEVFVALPSINVVVFSGYSQRIDKKTAKLTDEYLLSAKITRNKWQTIDFNNLGSIDVTQCFEMFELRRKATKNGVISPIEPFE